MSCRSWVASCPPLLSVPWKSGGNCGPQSTMNDEFVSHNNSSGGWDRLNKWVSMLKKRGCVADPLKGAGGLFCVLNWKLHCVFNLWNFIKVVVTLSWEDDLLILSITYLSSWCSVTKGVCTFGSGFDLSCQNVLVCKKCGKMRCSEQREGFVSRNVGVKVENVLPADLLLHSAPALLQCARSDLRERLGSFHLCLFRVLQLHLHLCSAPDSQC